MFSSSLPVVGQLCVAFLFLPGTVNPDHSACSATQNRLNNTISVKTMSATRLNTETQHEAYWLAGLAYSQIETDAPPHLNYYFPYWRITKPWPSLAVRAQLVQVTGDGEPTRVTYEGTLDTTNYEKFLFTFSGKLQANNTGNYRLVVVIPEPSFNLHVVIPPKVTSLDVNQAHIGQTTVSHRCCASGYPRPTVTWSVNSTTCSKCVETPPESSLVTSGLWSVCKNLTVPRQFLVADSVWNLSCTASANFSPSKCSPPLTLQRKCERFARAAATNFSFMRVSGSVRSTLQRFDLTSSETSGHSPQTTLVTPSPTTANTSEHSPQTTHVTSSPTTAETLSATTYEPDLHYPETKSDMRVHVSSAVAKSDSTNDTTPTSYVLPIIAGLVSFLLGLAAAYILRQRKKNSSDDTLRELARPPMPAPDSERLYAEPEFVNLHKAANLPTALELTKSAAHSKLAGNQDYENSRQQPDAGKIDDSQADYMILVD